MQNRDAEWNTKRLPLDESILVNDFRAAVSKLNSQEQSALIRSALKSLDLEKIKGDEENNEKYDRPRLESISLSSNFEETESHNGIAENGAGGTKDDSKETERLRKKNKELQKENEFLSMSLEELDKGHSQSLGKLFT